MKQIVEMFLATCNCCWSNAEKENTNTLDVVIAVLKENDNYVDDDSLVMASSRKAASKSRGSPLRSRKEGLSLSAKKSYKKLGR